jgi:hypothetical protein
MESGRSNPIWRTVLGPGNCRMRPLGRMARPEARNREAGQSSLHATPIVPRPPHPCASDFRASLSAAVDFCTSRPRSVARLLPLPCVEEERSVYSILYIIGAIVVIIVVLKVLGLY